MGAFLGFHFCMFWIDIIIIIIYEELIMYIIMLSSIIIAFSTGNPNMGNSSSYSMFYVPAHSQG